MKNKDITGSLRKETKMHPKTPSEDIRLHFKDLTLKLG